MFYIIWDKFFGLRVRVILLGAYLVWLLKEKQKQASCIQKEIQDLARWVNNRGVLVES